MLTQVNNSGSSLNIVKIKNTFFFVVKFDEYGLRTQFALSLMELQMEGLVSSPIRNEYEDLTNSRCRNSHGGLAG